MMICLAGLCFFGMPPLQHETSEKLGTSVEIFATSGMLLTAVLGLIALRVRTGVKPSSLQRESSVGSEANRSSNNSNRGLANGRGDGDNGDGGGERNKARSSIGSFQGIFFGTT